MWLAGIMTVELIGAIANRRKPRLDYFAHFGGYLAGAAFAMSWRAKVRREREKNRGWLDKVISK